MRRAVQEWRMCIRETATRPETVKVHYKPIVKQFLAGVKYSEKLALFLQEQKLCVFRALGARVQRL